MFPCDDGDILCVRRGGPTCIGTCEAEDMRTCGELACLPAWPLEHVHIHANVIYVMCFPSMQ